MLDCLEPLLSPESLADLSLKMPSLLELDPSDFNEILNYLEYYQFTTNDIANLLELYPMVFETYPKDMKSILETIYYFSKDDTKFIVLEYPEILIENPNKFKDFCQEKAKNIPEIESLIEEYLQK